METNFLNNQEEQNEKPGGATGPLIMKKKEAIARYDDEIQQEQQQKKSAFASFKNRFSHSTESQEDMGGVLNTNLIKNEITSFINWQEKTVVLILYFLLLIVFLLGSYAYAFYLEKKEIAKNAGLNDEIAVIKYNIGESELKVDKGLALQKKISLAQSILSKHIYWSPFFKFLEETTSKDVYYKSFSCDTEGSYKFPASAQGGYYTVSEQVKTLRENDLVRSVELLEASPGKSGVGEIDFSIQLELNKKIFQK